MIKQWQNFSINWSPRTLPARLWSGKLLLHAPHRCHPFSTRCPFPTTPATPASTALGPLVTPTLRTHAEPGGHVETFHCSPLAPLHPKGRCQANTKRQPANPSHWCQKCKRLVSAKVTQLRWCHLLVWGPVTSPFTYRKRGPSSRTWHKDPPYPRPCLLSPPQSPIPPPDQLSLLCFSLSNQCSRGPLRKWLSLTATHPQDMSQLITPLWHHRPL